MKFMHKSKIIALGFLALLASCNAIEGMGYLKSWLSKFGPTQEQINKAEQCPICQEDFTRNDLGKYKTNNLAMLNCDPKVFHIFHKECLNKSIKAGNKNCPMCRAPIPKSYIDILLDASIHIGCSAFFLWRVASVNGPDIPVFNARNLACLSGLMFGCNYVSHKLTGSFFEGPLLDRTQFKRVFNISMGTLAGLILFLKTGALLQKWLQH